MVERKPAKFHWWMRFLWPYVRIRLNCLVVKDLLKIWFSRRCQYVRREVSSITNDAKIILYPLHDQIHHKMYFPVNKSWATWSLHAEGQGISYSEFLNCNIGDLISGHFGQIVIMQAGNGIARWIRPTTVMTVMILCSKLIFWILWIDF